MWQDRFYDRVIRSRNEYLHICKYIDENPAKWFEDDYYIRKDVGHAPSQGETPHGVPQ
jgi:hypothetical protein